MDYASISIIDCNYYRNFCTAKLSPRSSTIFRVALILMITFSIEELNHQLSEATHQIQGLQSTQPPQQPEDASSNYPSDTSIYG